MNQSLGSQQTPHISPSRASYGVSIVRILDCVITAPHCTWDSEVMEPDPRSNSWRYLPQTDIDPVANARWSVFHAQLGILCLIDSVLYCLTFKVQPKTFNKPETFANMLSFSSPPPPKKKKKYSYISFARLSIIYLWNPIFYKKRILTHFHRIWNKMTNVEWDGLLIHGKGSEMVKSKWEENVDQSFVKTAAMA